MHNKLGWSDRYIVIFRGKINYAEYNLSTNIKSRFDQIEL